MQEVSSTTQKAGWYSPGADAWSERFFCSTLLQRAHAKNAWDKVRNIWLGALCKVEHAMIVRRVAAPYEAFLRF